MTLNENYRAWIPQGELNWACLAHAAVLLVMTASCGMTPKGGAAAPGAAALAGGGGSSGTSLVASTGSPLAAFQSGFYALATASNSCVGCHTSTGTELIYPFADPNVNVACQAALLATPLGPIASPANIPGSVAVAYSSNSHCGTSACTATSNSATVTAALTSWAAAVAAMPAGTSPCSASSPASLAAGGSGTSTSSSGSGTTAGSTVMCPVGSGLVPPSADIVYTTPLKPLPAVSSLPVAGTTATTGALLSWTLSTAGTPAAALNGAVIQVQVQSDNGGSTYHVFQPTMILPKTATATLVSGLHVLVQQTSQPAGNACEFTAGANWAPPSNDAILGVSVAPGTIPATLSTTTPLATTTLLSKDSALTLSSGQLDSLSIGIEAVGGLPPTFTYLNAAIFNGGAGTPNCVSCHNPTTDAGGFSLETYGEVFAQVVAGSPSTSLIYEHISGAVAPLMPPSPAPSVTPEQLQAVSQWITNGAPNN